MEGREQQAALLLCPDKASLVAFHRRAADSDVVVATFARWEQAADGSGVVVDVKDAVQLPLQRASSGLDPVLQELVSDYLPAGVRFYLAMLNCASLDALLSNRLGPAVTKVLAETPEHSTLLPYCTERRSGGGRFTLAVEAAQRIAARR